MKYTSTIKSRQFILAEKGKKIFIEPGEGEMKEDEAFAVAKSVWGKRLIEAGSLKFEKTIEIKEEKVERGMTIPKGEEKPSEKPSGEGTGNENEGKGAPEGGSGKTGEEEIPELVQNPEGEGSGNKQ